MCVKDKSETPTQVFSSEYAKTYELSFSFSKELKKIKLVERLPLL